MPKWLLEWRDKDGSLLEHQQFFWLADAEQQVERWLRAMPTSQVRLLRRLQHSVQGTEVTVFVRDFPANPGDPAWIEPLVDPARLVPPPRPLGR